jgi:hypothetical protein
MRFIAASLRFRFLQKSLYIASPFGFILLATAAFGQEAPAPFAEPSVAYLEQFRKPDGPQFVLERFDAKGELYERQIEPLARPAKILSPTRRQFNAQLIELRGLNSCPNELVSYSGKQNWACNDAAADYMNAIYNDRASVVLCKTLVLRPQIGLSEPASCFALVGDNASDPFAVVNDDDTMVFLGLADIRRGADGKPMRPDLLEAAALGKSMNEAPDDQ